MVSLLAAHSLPQTSRILDVLAGAQLYFPIALIVIGALLMIFGFKAYRWIVLLNCIALGYWVGSMLGDRAQIGLIGGILGAVLMGAAAMPLMKYAVAACGGLVGMVLGMVVWAYCEQPLDMAWAGGLVGLAVLGMLTFILFKTTVIVFTSIEGAALLVLGLSALLIRYSPWSHQVDDQLTHRPILLPILVLSTAIVALFWQHQKHGLIGNDGAPAGKAAGGGGGGGGGESKKK